MRRLIICVVVACLVVIGLLAARAFADKPPLDVRLARVGTYRTGVFDDKGAQILDYHAPSTRLFITNCSDKTIDVVDILAVGRPKLLFQIELSGKPLSVAVHPSLDLVAVSCKAKPATDPGTVEFFSIDGESLGDAIEVGALPDMIVWTPNGEKLLVANEGEPSDDYTIDPEGSVSIITLGAGVETAGFDGVPIDAEVRIFGPEATAAQDLEPEYIAVSDDSSTAWVTLQENNAIAKLDIDSAQFEWVRGLGYKDHSAEGNGLDASNKDKAINIQTWPVLGMYQPDAIATFTINGGRYLITANEGDAREYVYEIIDPETGEEIEVVAFCEEARVADLTLDPVAFPDWEELQDKKKLGRLKVTTSFPAEEGPDGYAELYSFGARSFTIWTDEGELVFDSGDQLEQIIAEAYPDFFNTTDDKNKFDDRSDDKGPEPEHVIVGKIAESTIAFIGLERMGGIVAYDVSDPANPRFLDYVNNRNFKEDPEIEDGVTNRKVRDLGTEGLIFIPADKSPMDQALVVASNEVSGTTTIYIVVT